MEPLFSHEKVRAAQGAHAAFRRRSDVERRIAVHADRSILVPGLLARLDGSGTTAWQAFCAAHSLLGQGFPTRHQRHADPRPQIDALREQLRGLLEAR